MGYAEGQADGLAAALAYRYQLRPGQLTEARAQSFHADYAQALTELRENPAGFGAATPEVARILWRWRALNRRAESAAKGRPCPLGHYHQYVANYLARRRG
jgi:uncharacterized protein RhaS with RHS repeats